MQMQTQMRMQMWVRVRERRSQFEAHQAECSGLLLPPPLPLRMPLRMWTRHPPSSAVGALDLGDSVL